MPPTAPWRLIVTPAADGAENMALDEALMERARETGEWVLRVYSWSTPTISLGRNQSARGRYDLARIDKLRVRRRPAADRGTGDSAPSRDHVQRDGARRRRRASCANRTTESIGCCFTALHSLGVARVRRRVRRRAALSPGMAPCFDEPSAGELTVDGRKLAGSAQWRADGALLQHGSILVERRSELARDAWRVDGPAAIRQPGDADAKRSERRPSVDDVAAALADAVRELEDANAPTSSRSTTSCVPERRRSSSDT